MYAVNMLDWLSFKDDIGISILLHPVTDARETVECEKGRTDGTGICLECDDERAAAIVEIARKKYKRHELRFYRSKTGKGGWKRV